MRSSSILLSRILNCSLFKIFFIRYSAVFASLLGISFSAYLFYPGFMNGDALWQLSFARQLKFIDWHPPMMSLIWIPLDQLIPGSGGMFLLIIALYWIAIATFTYETYGSPWKRFIAVIVCGLSPALFIGTALILKDGLCTVMLMLATALLRRQESHPRSSLRYVSLLLIFIAAGLRYNSLVAIPPLLYYYSSLSLQSAKQHTKLTVTFLYLSLFVILLMLVNRWSLSESHRLHPSVFFNSEKSKTSAVSNFPAQMILTYDLVGISYLTGVNYLPEFFLRNGASPFTQKDLEKIYSPDTGLWIFFYPDPTRRAPGFAINEQEFGELWDSWVVAILNRPHQYFKHRLSVFLSHAGINPVWPYWYPSLEDMKKSNLPNIEAKQIIGDWVTNHRDRFYFRNYFYFISLPMLALTSFIRGRLTLGSKCLIVSAALLLVSHLFLLPGGDFRYSWWIIAVYHFIFLSILGDSRSKT